MTLPQQNPGELFKQSEEGYLQFLEHYFRTQISYLQTMSFSPSPITEQKYAEKQLVISLTLVNNIFMHLYSQGMLVNDYIYDYSYNYLNKYIEEIEYLISQFKIYIKKQPFLSDSFKFQCKQLIDLLSRYLYKNQLIVMNTDTNPPKPWLGSSSLFPD